MGIVEIVVYIAVGVCLFTMVGVTPKQVANISRRCLPKRKPKAAVEPVKVKSLAEVHAEDHAWWLAEALAIVRQKCDHLYHSQSWYTCYMCGQEERWEYKEGCSCRKEEVRAICDTRPTYILKTRSPSCSVHGKDYKLMPISDRKVGPFGGRMQDWNDEAPYTRSKELTKGRSLRKIDFTI